MGECLWYGGEKSTARMMVLDLIVDDGVESRGHRKGVFNPDYTAVGCAYGNHCTFGKMAAMEFARDWRPKEEAITKRIKDGPVTPDEKTIAKAKAAAGKAASSTAWALGTCPICKEAIRGGKVMDVEQLGGKLHAECFACNACKKALKGVPFKVHGGVPYCSSCHAEKFGEKCTACSKPITGGMIKCSLGTFCVECVVCSKCNKSIGKAKFSTEGGVMTCSSCSKGGGGAPQSGRSSSPAPGARGSPPGPGGRGASPALSARAAGAKSKAAPAPKGKAKAKPKASMGGAREQTMGIMMDYASLE